MHLTIEPKGEKGRAFAAEMVAYAECDRLWTRADVPNTRPIWAVFAGPAEELRAFVANLLQGAIASDGQRAGKRVQMMRSAGYRFWTRALPNGGACTTFVLPDLLGWTPPVDDTLRHRFAILPAREWVDAQRVDVARAAALLPRLAGAPDKDTLPNLHRFLVYGALFLHYLDQRLPLPMPRDPVFGLSLLLSASERSWASIPEGRRVDPWGHQQSYRVVNPERAGVYPGLSFCPPGGSLEQQRADLAEWIGAVVQRWYNVTGGV